MESNSKVGTWCLLHRLVAHHVKLLVEIVIDVVWGVQISIGRMGGFFVPVTLAVGVLRQASIVLVDGLTILGDAIMANMEQIALEP